MLVALLSAKETMAQQSYPIPKSNPNAMMSYTFFVLWVVTAGVIALANMLFPQDIVLGTMSLSYVSALALSSAVLAWLGTITMPIFTEIEIRQKMVLTPQHWIIGYGIINVVGIWIIARLAEQLGLGISSWMFVVGLALVLDIIQGMAMMAFGEMMKPKQS